jgi:hypothetical protein
VYVVPVRVYKSDEKKKARDLTQGFSIVMKRYTGDYIISDVGTLFTSADIPSTDDLRVIRTDTDDIKAYGEIAKWIIEEAKTPFMVGSVGNANPARSFKVSESEDMCFLCEANQENQFNLRQLRKDIELLRGFDWKDFNEAYYLRQGYINPNLREQKLPDYLKMLKETPELGKALQYVSMLPDSTEWWLARSYFSYVIQGAKNA